MELVTVFRTFDRAHAHLVRSRLEAANIPATVSHENAATALTGGGGPAVELRVEVGDEFADDARALIAASERAE